MTHETERDAAPAADPVRLHRRALLGGAAVAVFGAGAARAQTGAAPPPPPPFAQPAPAPAAPAAAAAPPPSGPKLLDFPGKARGLVLLGDRPLVAETPEAMLDDDTTPIDKFFIRNNGIVPDSVTDPDAWKIVVEGEVEQPLTLTLGELKSRFKARTYHMVLECGGNGRSFFTPPGRGNQWTNGGAGCAAWTGVRLADVLKAAKLKKDARYTGHFGADRHLSGDAARQALSRGMPIAKAMERHTLIVWAMNGQPLPAIHGGPARLLVPGWPGSLSSKWLTRILVRKDPHDGQGMGGTSYRIPTVPIVPGSNVDGKTNFKDMESMPVRAIVTAPANGARMPAGRRAVALRGAAWAGDREVARVDVSIDAGQSWKRMKLGAPRNRYDWRRWTGEVALPSDGYYEIWARATDDRGVMQPHVATNWNPQGYGANPMHRLAILVG